MQSTSFRCSCLRIWRTNLQVPLPFSAYPPYHSTICFLRTLTYMHQVEYAGKVWDPEKYPFQTVARLIFPKQESFDYTRKSFWEEHIRVDPFLGLESFRPLGGSNRLRRVVYPRSSQLRRKLNAKPEIHVKDIGEIP